MSKSRRDSGQATSLGWVQSELYTTRSTLFELLPPDIKKMLDLPILCRTRDEVTTWFHSAVERTLDMASKTAKSAAEMGEWISVSDRAYCPLCLGEAAIVAGGYGFALPEGLKRHLVGSHGSKQCKVMEQLFALCTSHVDE